MIHITSVHIVSYLDEIAHFTRNPHRLQSGTTGADICTRLLGSKVMPELFDIPIKMSTASKQYSAQRRL